MKPSFPVSVKPSLWRAVAVLAALWALLLLSACGATNPARQSEAALPSETAVLPTDTPVPSPTPTETPAPTPTATQDPCPSTPERWSFSTLRDNGFDVSSNWMGLSPACAFKNLEPWIAFTMLIQNGYSIREAATMTGVPVDQTQPKMLREFLVGEDLYPEKVYWYLPGMNIPPDMRTWQFDADTHRYDARLVLWGCARKTWVWISNGDYGELDVQPVFTICAVRKYLPGKEDAYQEFEREDGSTARAFREWAFPGAVTMSEEFNKNNKIERGKPGYYTTLFYAYMGNGQWYYIGEDIKFDCGQFDTLEDLETNVRITDEFTRDLPVWDLNWLKERYGFEPRPLPQDFLQMNTTEQRMEVSTYIREYIKRFNPPKKDK